MLLSSPRISGRHRSGWTAASPRLDHPRSDGPAEGSEQIDAVAVVLPGVDVRSEPSGSTTAPCGTPPPTPSRCPRRRPRGRRSGSRLPPGRTRTRSWPTPAPHLPAEPPRRRRSWPPLPATPARPGRAWRAPPRTQSRARRRPLSGPRPRPSRSRRRSTGRVWRRRHRRRRDPPSVIMTAISRHMMRAASVSSTCLLLSRSPRRRCFQSQTRYPNPTASLSQRHGSDITPHAAGQSGASPGKSPKNGQRNTS